MSGFATPVTGFLAKEALKVIGSDGRATPWTNCRACPALDTVFKLGKQIYNITERGEIVKFQPGKTPKNGFHPYGVKSDDDIPPKVSRWLLETGKISKARYNKIRKNKEK